MYATVTWAPVGLGADHRSGPEYEIGSTVTEKMSADPSWDAAPRVAHRRLSTAVSEFGGKVEEGWETIKRTVYKTGHILGSSAHSSKKNKGGMLSNIAGKWDDDFVFLYPILQPLEDGELKGWREGRGALVIRWVGRLASEHVCRC